ncbi:MAG: hypothetical protein OXI90_03445 [Gammaproteobacteria bacterium]|nr:hypothetical protein [Gammaproteobacteria bacterium]
MTTDVEEARIESAARSMPSVAGRYDDIVRTGDGARLWRRAVADVQSGHLDDRPLYWARLKLRRDLDEPEAVDIAERLSRNFNPTFPSGVRRVLVTGFDPFHLDDVIEQSNPAGLVALALDGTTIAGAHVRTAILPVRFEAFDQGVVEDLLQPLFQCGLDLAVTISMGRDGFDLERFPGLRRSVETPDNTRAMTWASASNPLIPPDLAGTGAPEFLEFSLPATAMSAVAGRWPIRDNRRVTTLERGSFTVQTLKELAQDTAVRGSSGGFLSNEITYRSLLLQTRLGAEFPLGHLHTPALKGYDAGFEGDIVGQVRRIIAAALS